MKKKLAEFKAMLTADKKQATILAGLLAFLLISAGRMMLQMSPSKAKASSSTKAAGDKGGSENTHEAR